MRLLAFHTLRSGLQMQASPASTETLDVLAAQLRTAFADSAMFTNVEVDTSDDKNRLLIGLCTFDGTHAEEDVAAELESIWDDLRFDLWEAHATVVEAGHVELEASCLRGPSLDFVTLHVVAARCPVIPQQRESSEE